MASSEDPLSTSKISTRAPAATPELSGVDSAASAAFEALLRQLAGDALDVDDHEPLFGPGDRLGERFEVIALLGRGGMGVVYRAVDRSLAREVALKVLHQSRATDPEHRRRLLREARAAASVSHPNIAAVYEVGEIEGRVYLAMERIEGESLRARLARGPLAIAESMRLARQILEGLGAAHAAGLIHRDLKPDNVMVVPDGTVRLLDFGLAKRTGEPSASPDELTSLMTRAGQVLGTPAYMSPEQAAGDPVDTRSDLFSFGVLLYELLVGSRPFRGSTQVALIGALLRESPVAPAVASPEVGPALSSVVMRCLAKSPADRFADAASVLRALDELDVPTRRQKRPFVAAALLLALMVGAGLLAWNRTRNSRPSAPVANGESCRLGSDCISGSCVLDRCGPWSSAVIGRGQDTLNGIAVTDDSQLTTTGWFHGTIDLGCGPFSSAPTEETESTFVARFTREGTCVWSRRIAERGWAEWIIAAPNGHVIVLADFYGETDVGGGRIVSRGGEDIVVLELDAHGNHVRSMTIGGANRELTWGAIDHDGNVLLFGSYNSPTLELGSGTRLTLSTPGYSDIFVAKLSPAFELLWARSFGSGAPRSGNDAPYFGAVDAKGDLAVLGHFYDSLDLDGTVLRSAGEADTFLVKLSGSDGKVQWARGFGTRADEPFEGAAAFDSQGELFIAGEHRGADLGGGALPGTIYVARFSSSGDLRWSRGFGGDSPRDCARRLIIDREGAPVVFGRFLSAELDFDDRRLVNEGGSDLYVARFHPTTGVVVGVQRFFSTDSPVRAAAHDPKTGAIYVGGRFEGVIDFGRGPHKASDQGGYLGSLGPPP